MNRKPELLASLFPRVLIASFAVMMAIAQSASAKEEKGSPVKDVTVAEAKALLSGENPPVVIDLRTPDEYAAGHLPKAKVINFKADDFEEKLAKLDREKAYLMHCRSGGRSTRSLEVWKKLGFKKVFHLKAGWLGWEEAKSGGS